MQCLPAISQTKNCQNTPLLRLQKDPQRSTIPTTRPSTLPETNIFAPKKWMVGVLLAVWGPAYFQGRLLAVSFRECNRDTSEVWCSRWSHKGSWTMRWRNFLGTRCCSHVFRFQGSIYIYYNVLLYYKKILYYIISYIYIILYDINIILYHIIFFVN